MIDDQLPRALIDGWRWEIASKQDWSTAYLAKMISGIAKRALLHGKTATANAIV